MPAKAADDFSYIARRQRELGATSDAPVPVDRAAPLVESVGWTSAELPAPTPMPAWSFHDMQYAVKT